MKKIVLIIFLLLITFEVNAKSSVIDITSLTMEEIIDYLDKGVITSESLVELYLERINTFNSDYKAIITINNNILEEARLSDKLRKENKKRGILEGVPILVKDNIDVYGMPTTGGSTALNDNYPLEDAEVIKTIKDNGGLIIAKTNMSMFALSARNSCSNYGCVSNPFKLGYTSYGSSGGSASALALAFGSIALGTDTNSSVRLPAASSGLVGLRVSTGNLSNKGVMPYDANRDTIGIISRNVTDAIILYNLLNPKQEITNKEINIGIPNTLLNNYFLKNNLEELLNKLSNNNINIIYIDNYSTSKVNSYSYYSMSGYTMCKAFNNYLEGTTSKITNFKELSSKVSILSDYYKICNYTNNDISRTNYNKNKLKEYIDNIYQEYNLDYLLYPTNNNEVYLNNEEKLNNYTSRLSSTLGYPALSLPYTKYNDFYYSIELLGKKDNEDNLLNIASIIENIINLDKYSLNRLYEVNNDDKELLTMYMDNYNDNNKEQWLNKVSNYFLYNEGNNQELINDYYMLQKELSLSKRVVEYKKYDDTFILLLLTLLYSLLPFYIKMKRGKINEY